MKEKTTGVELIRDSKIEKHSFLVTSRFEEPEIMSEARHLGVRIIPKEMTRHLSVRFLTDGGTPRYVLLDDNQLTREVWEESARENGMPLSTFSSAEILMSQVSGMTWDTAFYIDHDLGSEEASGADVAKNLYSVGFRNIFISTGLREDNMPKVPWARGIIGKRPPWAKQIRAQG